MTPEEAVTALINDELIPRHLSRVFRLHFDACVTTETRRCADTLTEVIDTLDLQVEPEDYARALLEGCREYILRTGGLEVGE